MEYLEIVKIVGPIILGGLAGAVVSWRANLAANRKQIALKVVKDYFAKYSELARAMGVLHEPSSLYDDTQRNCMLAIGDWFELVTCLYNMHYANKRLLRQVGMTEAILAFRKDVEHVPELQHEFKQWKHLRSFSSC